MEIPISRLRKSKQRGCATVGEKIKQNIKISFIQGENTWKGKKKNWVSTEPPLPPLNDPSPSN